MKIFLILFLLLITSYLGYSQPLTFRNLIELRSKALNNVESFLLKRNWEFASSKEEDDSSCAIIAFKLNTNKSDEIVQYLYSESASVNRIWYATFNKNTFIQLTNQALAQNFKYLKNRVEGEALSNLYYGNGLYVIFRTLHLIGDNSESVIMYKLELYSAQDYRNILPL